MDMNLENFKDPSKIPNSLKFLTIVLLFAATVTAGFFLDTNDQITALDQLQVKETELRASWLDKKKQAVNLEAHKKQLADIEIAFGTLLRQLPNKSEMDALLNDVNQAGIGRGLSFDLFRPSTNEIITEFYAEQPVAITVSGNFHDVGSFAEDLSKLSRIVNLSDISIRNTVDPANIVKGTQPKLIMDATVRTYRYLDEKDNLRKKPEPAK
jgi:type IV pilus assembly protein PilO